MNELLTAKEIRTKLSGVECYALFIFNEIKMPFFWQEYQNKS